MRTPKQRADEALSKIEDYLGDAQEFSKEYILDYEMADKIVEIERHMETLVTWIQDELDEIKSTEETRAMIGRYYDSERI